MWGYEAVSCGTAGGGLKFCEEKVEVVLDLCWLGGGDHVWGRSSKSINQSVGGVVKTKTSHDSKICLLDSKCGKCSRFWTPDSFLLDLYTYQKFQFLVRAILLDLIKKLLQHSRCHFWERSVQEKKLTSWRHKIKCRGQFYILFCLERKK